MDTEFLKGIKVLDFSHMLAGPIAARRLGELGARVIKVEPKGGEGLRTGNLPSDRADGDHIRFHAYNRSKESVELDLKNPEDAAVALNLAKGCDVVVQSFRPGIMEKFGMGYEQLRANNRGLVYASFSGWGSEGPWRDDAGQDLQAQARAGLMWLNATAEGMPQAIGGCPADIMGGNILVQGILAGLVRRSITGEGGYVESSLMEAAIELHTDTLPIYMHRGEGPMPLRPANGGQHPYMTAPYGMFKTAEGSYVVISRWLAPAPQQFVESWPAKAGEPDFKRELTYECLNQIFIQKPAAFWLDYVRASGGWISEVLDWPRLFKEEQFKVLDILTPPVPGRPGEVLRAPLRLNGKRPDSKPAPRLNDVGDRVRAEGWGDS